MSDPQASPQVYVVESSQALAADAAELFVRMARDGVSHGPPFRVALSGGSTPRLLYGLLASDTFRQEIEWENIQFFFGDERWVPPTHRDSNFKMANDELFKKVEVSRDNIFPIPTESLSPDDAAAQYEQSIRRAFKVPEGSVPAFDLIFLGMGDDGHTASLFPHSDVLNERDKLVAAPYVEKLATHRITLTPPVLKAGREVLVLVAGEGKAATLVHVLEGEENIEEYPTQLLRRAQGKVTWLLDRPAASQLKGQYQAR